MRGEYSLEDARDALRALDPGVERNTWIKVGMAAHAAGLTADDFIEWSSKADNYAGERDCRAVWRSFHSGQVSAGSLFYLAREAGWEPRASGGAPIPIPASPAASRGTLPVRAEAQKVALPEQPDAQQLAKVRSIVDSATLADGEHPYLKRKRVGPGGLFQMELAKLSKLLHYTPSASGNDFSDRAPILLVPLTDGRGNIGSLEFIDADGRKAAMARLPRAGLMFTQLPIEATSAFIGIAEGIATARSAERALGYTVVAAGSRTNMRNVALAARQIAPGAEILILGDVGAGEDDARAAAEAVYGHCVIPLPDELPPGGTDFNDVEQHIGLDAMADALELRASNPRRITFRQARERAHIDYVLPGLPAGHVGLLVGQGSVGKSFLALELAISVSLGRSVLNIDSVFPMGPSGRTAILFGEDDRSIVQNRMNSVLEACHLTSKEEARLDQNMAVISLVGEDMRIVQTDGRVLTQGQFVTQLEHFCHGRRLVFVDPLIRLHDADENDNTAASHLMLAISRIARNTRCAIVLLHHVGKGDKDGWQAARGASAIVTTARWQLNLAPPSAEEREKLNLDEAAVSRHVKVAGVKMNYAERRVDSFWLRRGQGGVLTWAPDGPENDRPSLSAFDEAANVGRSPEPPGNFRRG